MFKVHPNHTSKQVGQYFVHLMLLHLHDNWVEHILDWKRNELQNMSRNIYDLKKQTNKKHIFVCWKFKCSKYTQIIQINRCTYHPATNSTMTKLQHTAPSLTFFDQSLSVASRELLRQRMGTWWSRLTISKKAHSSFTSTFRISAGLSGGWSSRLRFP